MEHRMSPRPYTAFRSHRALCGRLVSEIFVILDDGTRVRRIARDHSAAVAALPASVDRARLPSDWS
jgi:hypothetical protein